MSKKAVLWISGIGTILLALFVVAAYFASQCMRATLFACPTPYSSVTEFILMFFGSVFFSFPFIFLFSWVLYKTSDNIFRVWVRFTYVWVVVSTPIMIFVLLVMTGVPAGFIRIWDSSGLWLMPLYASAPFVLASILIIAFQIKYRGTGTNDDVVNEQGKSKSLTLSIVAFLVTYIVMFGVISIIRFNIEHQPHNSTLPQFDQTPQLPTI